MLEVSVSEVKGSECSIVYGQVVTHRACEQASLCGNPYLSSLSAFNSAHSESLAAAANQLGVFVIHYYSKWPAHGCVCSFKRWAGVFCAIIKVFTLFCLAGAS